MNTFIYRGWVEQVEGGKTIIDTTWRISVSIVLTFGIITWFTFMLINQQVQGKEKLTAYKNKKK